MSFVPLISRFFIAIENWYKQEYDALDQWELNNVLQIDYIKVNDDHLTGNTRMIRLPVQGKDVTLGSLYSYPIGEFFDGSG